MTWNSLQNKTKEVPTGQEYAIYCECETCRADVDCSSTVTFNFVTLVRNSNVPVIGTNVPIFIEEICLKCVNELCYSDVNVSTPCIQSATIPCKVYLNRYSYVGYIKYLANIPRTGGDGSFICFSDCQCIDRVRCFTSADNCLDCPPSGFFIEEAPTATVFATLAIPGTQSVAVTVRVNLTLTSPCNAV